MSEKRKGLFGGLLEDVLEGGGIGDLTDLLPVGLPPLPPIPLGVAKAILKGGGSPSSSPPGEIFTIVGNPGSPEIKIDREITEEEAVEIIKRTPWAMNAGLGVARKLGLRGAEATRAAERWAEALARGLVREMKLK
ncbi:MAG: hypothetical protein QXW83_00120 [Nitrososphaerales archaeon]